MGNPFTCVGKRQGAVLRNTDVSLPAVRIRESGDRLGELGRLYLLRLEVQKVPLSVGQHFQELLVGEFVNRYWHSSAFHGRSEEHTSELQSHLNLVCRLLLEKKNNFIYIY